MRACERKAAGWKLLPLGRLLHSLSVSLDLALFITWASLFSHRLGCLAADYAAMASSTFDVCLFRHSFILLFFSLPIIFQISTK